MGAILFCDTETSDLVKWNLPLSDPSQPRMAQLALILQDDTTKKRLAQFVSYIRPNGWELSEEAAAVNGLTMELLTKYGITNDYAYHVFGTFARRARLIVAHNVDFDRKILTIEMLRSPGAAPMPEAPWFCTKEHSTDLCKLPKPGGKSGFKWPTLEEASRLLCGCDGVDGAHDALCDAEACMKLYWEIQRRLTLEPQMAAGGAR